MKTTHQTTVDIKRAMEKAENRADYGREELKARFATDNVLWSIALQLAQLNETMTRIADRFDRVQLRPPAAPRAARANTAATDPEDKA